MPGRVDDTEGGAIVVERNRRRATELRTLLIAPDVGLEGAGVEVQRAANALHPDILVGNVCVPDVMDALSANTYDVVWFATHGGPDGIQLTDGILPTETLTQLLRQACPGLVVLNTCTSVQIANQLHDELNCAVVATVLDVPDRDAYVTGTLLANALARGLSVQDAYNAAKPGRNRTYVLLNGSVRMGGDDKLDDVQRMLLTLSADLQRQLSDMRGEVGKLREELDAMRRDTERRFDALSDRYQPRSDRVRAAAWAAGFIVFSLTSLLMLKDVRDALGLRWEVAFVFSAVFDALAFGLFVWGLGFRLNR